MRTKKTAPNAAARRPRSSGTAAPSGAAEVGTGLLIAVELGATWPEAAADEGAIGRRRVVTQQEGETPAKFADRVASGLDQLFGRGIRLCALTLACNERIDDAAQDARRQLAGVTLGSMAKAQTGRAYLAGSTRSSARLRQALTSLAQSLHEEWRTAGLEVSVDFGERSSAQLAPTFTFTARVA